MSIALPQPVSIKLSHRIGVLIPYIGMFLLALLLWMPFSFKTTGLIEELGINGSIDEGNQMFFLTPSSVASTNRIRPLQNFTFAAAYTLDPNSYLYYNVFMLLFFVGKMVVVYWLVLEFLPGHKLLGFIAGILFTLYPSETGLFAFRTIHIHCSIVAYLFAVYLLIQFWKRRGRASLLALLGAALLLIFSLWQYQIALPLALVTPLALLYFGRPNKRFWLGAGVWYGAMIFILIYGLWAVGQSSGATHEDDLLQAGGFTVNVIQDMLAALLEGYRRQFAAWPRIFPYVNLISLYWPYLLAGLTLTLGIGWWLLRQQQHDERFPKVLWKHYAIVFVGGILLFAGGMAIYLPVPLLRLQEFRIYMLGIIGSALVLTLTLYFVSRLAHAYRDVVFGVLTIPFVGLALLNAFQQHQTYVNLSLDQQNILQQVVEQVPQYKPDTTLIFVDRIGALNEESALYYGFYIETALRYLYHDYTLKAYHCPINSVTILGASCKISSDGMQITKPFATEQVTLSAADYGHALIFETAYDNKLNLLTAEQANSEFKIGSYDPQPLITGKTAPLRATTMFSCQPALSCYHEVPSSPSTSFDLPELGNIGLGWRGSELDTDGGYFRWSVNPISSVDVNLSDTHDLTVEFVIRYYLSDEFLNSLKLSVNGENIPLVSTPWEQGGLHYQGTIPRSALTGHPSHTHLIFTVDHLNPVQGAPNVWLGFGLKTVHIRPA